MLARYDQVYEVSK